MNGEIVNSVARETGTVFVEDAFSDGNVVISVGLNGSEASQALGGIIVRFDDDFALLDDFETSDVSRFVEGVLEVEKAGARGTEGVGFSFIRGFFNGDVDAWRFR